MKAARTIKRSAALLMIFAITACDMGLVSSHVPPTRPADLGQPKFRPTSERSAALRSYLVQLQTAQLSQGLLREDGGGPDTPFTADMLARNFEKIVFYNEYASALQGRGGQSPLRKWIKPVRIDTIFGAGVPPSQRKQIEKGIREYAARLGKITGHPVSTYGKANFIVIVASEDDRGTALNAAAARLPAVTDASLDPLRKLDDGTYCVVSAYASGAASNTYAAAVAVIRAENPSLIGLSCIHEELAQGLGLANDSRSARPSIFNDDDEFALLTNHDEFLLKMLYDPRLKPGMSAAEAAPLTRIIARELTSYEPL